MVWPGRHHRPDGQRESAEGRAGWGPPRGSDGRRRAGAPRSGRAAVGRPGAPWSPGAPPEPLWARLDRREIVAALQTLPREQREAIELAFFGGLTHVEVA